jgi:single-stranded DNA-binding protein
MSVAVLISGSLFRAPEQRIAQSGKRFVSATLKVGGESGTADFWSALAFGDTAGADLMLLGLNERVAVQGSLKLETYTSNDGKTKISRTVFVDHVMALRQPPKERKAKTAPAGSKAADAIVKQSIVPPSSESSRSAASSTESASSSFYDDEIPF